MDPVPLRVLRNEFHVTFLKALLRTSDRVDAPPDFHVLLLSKHAQELCATS